MPAWLGFRIDAAKHMEPSEIAAILDRLPGQPFIVQEVIDRNNEPISGEEYAGNGHVSEFMYGMELVRVFSDRDLTSLRTLGSAEGWLASEQAVVFVDNHDVQRGHGGAKDILTHKDWGAYQLANIFMLAWPYGYPMVMSSYHFSDSDQGPPSTRPVNDQGSCSAEWVCEHRDPAIAAMVGFRSQTFGQPIRDWVELNPAAIAFSRGDQGFIAINAGQTAVDGRVPVSLAPGRYRNILGSEDAANEAAGDLTVGEDGFVTVSLPPMSALATHAGALR